MLETQTADALSRGGASCIRPDQAAIIAPFYGVPGGNPFSTSYLHGNGVPGGRDRIQLQQVVLHLVVNAIDAVADTASDDRVISIQTSRVAILAELAISDQGPGISEAGGLSDVRCHQT